MSIILLANELDNTEIRSIVFNYLRREHKAHIRLLQHHEGYKSYDIDGEDIPKGNINVYVEEIVPMVLAISIEKAQ